MKTILSAIFLSAIIGTVGCKKTDMPPMIPVADSFFQVSRAEKIYYSVTSYDSTVSLYSYDNLKRTTAISTTHYTAPSRGAIATNDYFVSEKFSYPGNIGTPDITETVYTGNTAQIDTVTSYLYYNSNYELIRDSIYDRSYGTYVDIRIYNSLYNHSTNKVTRERRFTISSIPASPIITGINRDTATGSASYNITSIVSYTNNVYSSTTNFSYGNKKSALSFSSIWPALPRFRTTDFLPEDIPSQNNLTRIQYSSFFNNQSYSYSWEQEGVDLYKANDYPLEIKFKQNSTNTILIKRYAYIAL